MSKPLLERNTRYLLIWLPLVLLVCSIIFFLVLLGHARHMQKEILILKRDNVWNAFRSSRGSMLPHIAGEYDLTEVSEQNDILPEEPRDTSLFFPSLNKTASFQVLTTRVNENGRSYLLSTYSSSTEINHLIIKIFLSEALILALMLLAIVILNRKSSALLWRPFFSTLDPLKSFDIRRNSSLTLPRQTGTSEFDALNKTISALLEHVNQAYDSQKQFVENASHEMQTPLAIIRAKLELLINQQGLTENSAALLADITEANERLSQMNRTLLLLARIENNQFPGMEQMNLSEELSKLVNTLKDHDEDFPQLEMQLENPVIVHANKSLIQILLSNLVNNAIVHNIPDGRIHISLRKGQLLIENTGPPLQTHPRELFDRFRKNSHQTRTTGLGLSLVKQICSLYSYEVNYEYSAGWHRLILNFH